MEQGATTNDMAAGVSALGWLVAAGVDTLVGDSPRNWLATAPVAAPSAPVAVRAAAVARVAGVPAAVTSPAAELAKAAPDLAALDVAIAGFAHPLRRAEPPRLLTGAVASGVIVLADQPEAVDSPADRLAARMLAAIGLDADKYARACLLPWHSGRAPKDDEIAAYAPFLARALALAAPRVVLAFGDKAAALSGEARGVAALRGRWLAIGGLAVGGVPMLATFHPNRLLTQPDLKRLAWADLQAFAERVRA